MGLTEEGRGIKERGYHPQRSSYEGGAGVLAEAGCPEGGGDKARAAD